jgi:hypothetical protein
VATPSYIVVCIYELIASAAATTFHGSNCSMRLMGCSAMRCSTSRKYASGCKAVQLRGADQAIDGGSAFGGDDAAAPV